MPGRCKELLRRVPSEALARERGVLRLLIHNSAGEAVLDAAVCVTRVMEAWKTSPRNKQWVLHRKWKHIKCKTAVILTALSPAKLKRHQATRNLYGVCMDAYMFLCHCTVWEG